VDYRSSILALAVRRTRGYVYPGCTVKNILTDRIYRAFANKMFRDSLDDARRDRRLSAAVAALEQLVKDTDDAP